jgi:hypothetical protein
VGLATLVVTLAALLPIALLGHTSWPAVSRRDALMFIAGIALLGFAVSWAGTWLWNTASGRLPTTTAGLLINVETISGYVYVYLARQELPPLGQLFGFALILAGVGLALTRRQAPGPSRQHRPPYRKPELPDGLISVPRRDPAAGPYSPPPARTPGELAAAGLVTQAPGIASKQKGAGSGQCGRAIIPQLTGPPELADLRSIKARVVDGEPPRHFPPQVRADRLSGLGTGVVT